MLVSFITINYASILLVFNIYYVFLSDENLIKKFFSQYIFLTICLIASVVSLIYFRRTEVVQLLAIPTVAFTAILFLFVDSISETADIYYTNPSGLFLLIIIQPFSFYIFSFLKRHTRLIGLGITLKQQESINSFITDVNIKKIILKPSNPGYSFYHIYENYTWSIFFSNFLSFFVYRHVSESKILVSNSSEDD